MNAILVAGYGYELAGLAYYLFFLTMARGRGAKRFAVRSRVLVFIAAFALVASVPFHYATTSAGVALMIMLALAALASALIDVRSGGAPKT